MAGLPLEILAPYRTFLETSQAHFQFGKYIGLPHRTKTSIPQGCPISMVFIAASDETMGLPRPRRRYRPSHSR